VPQSFLAGRTGRSTRQDDARCFEKRADHDIPVASQANPTSSTTAKPGLGPAHAAGWTAHSAKIAVIARDHAANALSSCDSPPSLRGDPRHSCFGVPPLSAWACFEPGKPGSHCRDIDLQRTAPSPSRYRPDRHARPDGCHGRRRHTAQSLYPKGCPIRAGTCPLRTFPDRRPSITLVPVRFCLPSGRAQPCASATLARRNPDAACPPT